MNRSRFIETIKKFHRESRRDLEWRSGITPYKVVVSEIMLQQTQVSRVTVKFPEFINAFPDFGSLSRAPVAAVLAAWQGMGYNRRALYLKKTAEQVTSEYNGELPRDPAILETFPGIGYATARSIACFSWNIPAVFIETNIRRVFIHFFFDDHAEISDKQIYPLVEETLDTSDPREWYYALMDYGSVLSKTVENPNRRSKHYAKQPSFEGSSRKIRGEILRQLLSSKSIDKKRLMRIIDDERFPAIIGSLIKEGFVKDDGTMYSIV